MLDVGAQEQIVEMECKIKELENCLLQQEDNFQRQMEERRLGHEELTEQLKGELMKVESERDSFKVQQEKLKEELAANYDILLETNKSKEVKANVEAELSQSQEMLRKAEGLF